MMRHPLMMALAAALVFCGAPSLAGEPPSLRLMAITEINADANGHFFATAAINGHDIAVLVDTGATAVALSYEDAAEAGLSPGSLTFDIPVSTANGVTQAARVKLDRVAIDGLEVEDVDAMVLPEGALRGTLLGMSFLGRLSGFKVEDGVLRLKD